MSTRLVTSIDDIRAALSSVRHEPARVGLVPTMGALHAGHATLIERARRECNPVVVSIFVNPLQFDRKDDLEAYPRTVDADLSLCSSLGVDFVFAPEPAEMYPREPSCVIRVGKVAEHLCGHYRPGHFDGVATVVMKLFQIVQPHRAYFGEKDAQQLAVIRHLVRDFNVPLEIAAVSTVREDDGLALSSRNRRLRPDERPLAISLYSALCAARQAIAAGTTDVRDVQDAARVRVPNDPRVRLEYFEIVDPEEIQPVTTISGPVLVAGALWVGSVRLIDNMLCQPPDRRL